MLQNAIQSTLPYLQISETPTMHRQVLESNEARNMPSFLSRVNRLEYRDKVQYTFSVSERFSSHFVLIKGLIDFHRPNDINFSFNRQEKSIEVRTHLHNVDFLFQFLQKVQEWLVKEMQFKLALKKIIQFETQYHAKRTSIYNSLFGI
jgi:hypothetical protein